MSYNYVNTSTTLFPPIIYSRWEVRNSGGVVLGTLEGVGKIDFLFAFPFLDTFTVSLTVRDSALNEGTETKTYVVDECPYIPRGGAPSGPAIAENYEDVPGKIILKGIKTSDLDECKISVKINKIFDSDIDGWKNYKM